MNKLNKRNPIASAIKRALLTTAAISLMATGSVYAEEATEEEADAVEEKITITGSRIKRVGVDTAFPAVVVTAQELQDRGFTNVADALNELSSFGNPDATPQGAQLGSSVGQNFVDFLGLGAQRTLTLVNGRRFVSSNTPSVFGESGGLQVDFNVIPIALVDRIETIGVGGAPIYGADAIAGTINVILKDDYEGFEVTLQAGQTDKNDGKDELFSFVAGANFSNGKGNITVSGEWFTQDGLLQGARPRFTENDPLFSEVGGVRQIIRDRRLSAIPNGGLASPPGSTVLPSIGLGSFADGNFYIFDSNSNLVPFNPGAPAPGQSPIWSLGGDGSDFFDQVTQIQSPLERFVFTSRVTYDLTDDVTFSSDFLFANSTASELVNQGGFQTAFFGGTSGALTFSSDNPFLPQATQQLLNDNGLSTFDVSRFNNDLLDSRNFREQFVWRYTAGLEGDFYMADRNFFWDVDFVFGRSDGDENSFGIIDDRFFNAVDVRQISQADVQELANNGLTTDDLLGLSGTASANVGDIICESVYQATLGNITGTSGSGLTDADLPFIEGCVPLNVFGFNAASAAARAFIEGNQTAATEIEQMVYTFNFGGEIVELPGGWASFNIGLEKRTEKADFIPGLGNAISLTRSSAFARTGGEYTTDDIFGEIVLPLISSGNDVAGVEHLEFSFAYRDMDNSLSGKGEALTAAIIYSPVQDITFRANYTESLRTPALVELFAPIVRSFSSAADPCDFRNVDDGPDAANRRANCAADISDYANRTQQDGVTPGFESEVVTGTKIGRTGGNPDLENETSESWSVGATIEPRWVENLTITFDLFDIELSDAISSLTLTALMESCYDSTDFANTSSCDRFTRDSDGQIIDFLTGQSNSSIFSVQQLDSTVRYRYDTEGFGRFGTFLRWTHLLDRDQSVNGEPNDPTRGGYTDPKNSATLDFTWENDDWRVFWRVQWQEAAELDPTADDVFQDEDGNTVTQTDARFMHNMSAAYFLPNFMEGGPESTTIRFSIDNVFNRKPDAVQEAAGHFGFSELLGRSYNLTLNMSF